MKRKWILIVAIVIVAGGVLYFNYGRISTVFVALHSDPFNPLFLEGGAQVESKKVAVGAIEAVQTSRVFKLKQKLKKEKKINSDISSKVTK